MQYRAWGLSIESPFSLPLAPREGAEGAAAVTVALAGGAGEARTALEWTPEWARVGWADVGTFHVRGGQSVTIAPAPGVTEAALAAALCGSVLPLLLLQRGALVLHASAVALRGEDGRERAVVLLGESGAGKSTLAAALAARGHRALCDDIVALYPDEPGLLRVAPGVPFVKLRAPSLLALGYGAHTLPGPDGLPVAAPSWTPDAAALAAVIVLAQGSQTLWQPLALPEALGVLLRHSLAQGVLEPAPPTDLARAARVAQSTVVTRFHRPHDWAQMGAAVEAGLGV